MMSHARKHLIGEELRRFGEQLHLRGDAQVQGRFAGIAGADELLREDPNAFLLGILFTQGVPAERAWAGPYLLRERLGHLDLRRLAAEPCAVGHAVARPPALHRFKVTLADWIVEAARMLVDEYASDAANVWPEGSSVAEVIGRLSRFKGIGRKKAAMAAEILRRHLGVRLSGCEEGKVAYDVHVRRVFLRSGLADHDTPEDIDRAASTASPDWPGVLDLPAWLIGREHCRPSRPACDDCRLGDVCERRVWLDVDGVGARRDR